MVVVSWFLWRLSVGATEFEICEKICFLEFLCNTRKLERTEIKKVKLNRLIHLKIVLVEDHVEYKKETRKSAKKVLFACKSLSR